MNRQCENCGQTILDSDDVCWHCGWRLPSERPLPPTTSRTAEANGPPVDISLPAILVYGVWTLIVITAILMVMRSLGNKPLDLSVPGRPLGSGWSMVADQEEAFSLQLPPGWHWLAKHDDSTQADFEDAFSQNNRFSAIIAPFDGTELEMQSLAIASEPRRGDNRASSFIFIARESEQSQTPLEDAIARMQRNNDDIEILQANVFIQSDGRSRGAVFVEMTAADGEYRCEEKWLIGPEGIIFVAACTPSNQYHFYSQELQAILASFELMTR